MSLSVIVFCGGQGSRIKPVLGSLPKILAPIANKSFIDFLLPWISNSLGSVPHKIVLSTGIGHQAIHDYIQKNLLTCSLSKEEKPLGTFGALINVVQKVNIDDYVLLLNGDTIFDVDFSYVFNQFLLKPNVPLLLVKSSLETGRYGGYSRLDNGKIKFCNDNPEFISLGAFFCRKTDVMACKDNSPVSPGKGLMLDTDFLDQSDIDVFVVSPEASFIDIGVPTDYQKAQQLIPSNFSL